MISYLNGKIAYKDESRVIIDVGGVGFGVAMPLTDIGRLPEIGGEAKVHTYLHVQEDAMKLYGFCDKEGLEYFNRLISVNGVGCKAAIAILSALPPSDLALAIISGDSKAITRAQGVGAKIAQRIILELKGKIDTMDAVGTPAKQAASFAPSADVSAINALIALGCSPSEAQKTVMQINSEGMGLSTEDIIKEALRRMSNGI